MSSKAFFAALVLCSIFAGTAEAAQYYPGWICRAPEWTGGTASGDPEYTSDGSYLEPYGTFQYPLAICPIPVDSSAPISGIRVYYKIEPLSQGSLGHGITCQAEMRSMTNVVLATSNTFSDNIVGEGTGVLSLPAMGTTAHFVMVRCNLGNARIRSLRAS